MVYIEIKIPKEIRNYHENIFFGLNTRQFVCSLLALGAAVGLYFCLRPIVGTEQVGWMCILGAAPFAACGFFSYHSMTAEQLLWAWIKSEILMPKRLVFRRTACTTRSCCPPWPRAASAKPTAAPKTTSIKPMISNRQNQTETEESYEEK